MKYADDREVDEILDDIDTDSSSERGGHRKSEKHYSDDIDIMVDYILGEKMPVKSAGKKPASGSRDAGGRDALIGGFTEIKTAPKAGAESRAEGTVKASAVPPSGASGQDAAGKSHSNNISATQQEESSDRASGVSRQKDTDKGQYFKIVTADDIEDNAVPPVKKASWNRTPSVNSGKGLLHNDSQGESGGGSVALNTDGLKSASARSRFAQNRTDSVINENQELPAGNITAASFAARTHSHKGLDDAQAFYDSLKLKAAEKAKREADEAAKQVPLNRSRFVSSLSENDSAYITGEPEDIQQHKRKAEKSGLFSEKIASRAQPSDKSGSFASSVSVYTGVTPQAEKKAEADKKNTKHGIGNGAKKTSYSGDTIVFDANSVKQADKKEFVKLSSFSKVPDPGKIRISSNDTQHDFSAIRDEKNVPVNIKPEVKPTAKPEVKPEAKPKARSVPRPEAEQAVRPVENSAVTEYSDEELDGQISFSEYAPRPITSSHEAAKPDAGLYTDETNKPAKKNKPERSGASADTAVKNSKMTSKTENHYDDYDDFDDESGFEYRSHSDASEVKADLVLRLKSLRFKTVFTLLIFVLMLAAVFADRLGIPYISPANSPVVFLSAMLFLTGAAVLINARSVFGGLAGFFRLSPDLDTPVSIGIFTVLLAGAAALAFSGSATYGGVFGASAVLSVIIGNIGKSLMIKRITENFEVLSAPGEKFCVFCPSSGLSRGELTKGLAGEKDMVCCDAAAEIPSGFLRCSFEEDAVDIKAQSLSMWLPTAGAAMAAISLILSGSFGTADILKAVSAFSGTVLAALPLCSLLSVNVLLKKECRRLNADGGILSSSAAVESFANSEVIATDSGQLFPEGTVQLVNMKGCNSVPIDRSILDAAGVSYAAGGPFAGVFMSVLGGNTDMLPKVSSVVYEEKKGLSAQVDGRSVLIGRRELMEAHGVALPSADLIGRYESRGVYTVYVADSFKLSALFFIRYTADSEIADALRDAQNRGIGLSVYSVDPNINEKMLCELFGLSVNGVRIMSAAARRLFKDGCSSKRAQSALLTHIYDAGSLARSVISCKRLSSRIAFFGVLQIILMLCGLFFSCLCVVSGSFTAAGLLLYQAACLVITLLFDAVL